MMILEDIIHFLEKVPPFQFLDETTLKDVAKNIAIEFYPKDTVILRQDGVPSDSLRIIKKAVCGSPSNRDRRGCGHRLPR